MKPILKIFLVGAAMVQLNACSKTVRWEEEVPLNTGEVIWVKRTVEYALQGGAGNPFDTAYRPEQDQAIEFQWRGKNYRYQGDARIMLLAISQQNEPVLVAQAEANSWNWRHNYTCTTPFYVQLVPDVTGRIWKWPARIETWLYNLPSNLLLERHPPHRMKKRYTTPDRAAEDHPGSRNMPSQLKIDPTYTGDLCRLKEK